MPRSIPFEGTTDAARRRARRALVLLVALTLLALAGVRRSHPSPALGTPPETRKEAGLTLQAPGFGETAATARAALGDGSPLPVAPVRGTNGSGHSGSTDIERVAGRGATT